MLKRKIQSDIANHLLSGSNKLLTKRLQEICWKVLYHSPCGTKYHNNILPIMNDEKCINLGSVYETVVAQELKTQGQNLYYYYDNKKNGEVDYLIDDFDNMTSLPIEVKSGKDYTQHSALNRFLANPDYHVSRAYVLSNECKVYEQSGIVYMPIYNVMFLSLGSQEALPTKI